MKIESVVVFCGSKPGNNPVYTEHATELGKLLALAGIKLVYGGGNKGLMGSLADGLLTQQGKVIGVMPKLLVEWEQQHKGLTEIAIVPDMHTRKKMMYELCDAAVVLPGGFGTLDELFEILTWNQLKIHNKKIYILNSGGFYNHLIMHLKQMHYDGFLYEPLEDRIVVCDTPAEIFNKIG